MCPGPKAAPRRRLPEPPSSQLAARPQSFRTEAATIFRDLGRPWNAAPSFGIVLLGAWAAAGRTAAALLFPPAVLAMGAISTAVAVASCVVNDYFDVAADAVNAARAGEPGKPLVTGAIRADRALLFSLAAYAGALGAGLLLPQRGARLVVAGAAAATLLYTPVLKRLFLVKNLTVAAVVATAPLAGALAAGAGAGGAAAVLPACAFVFLGTLFRELMMDVTDLEGDKAAGVRTLPVVLGRGPATAVALAYCAAMVALAWRVALTGSGLDALAATGLQPAARAAAGAAVSAAIGAPAARAARAWRDGFPPADVAAAVEGARVAIGVGLVGLTLLA